MSHVSRNTPPSPQRTLHHRRWRLAVVLLTVTAIIVLALAAIWSLTPITYLNPYNWANLSWDASYASEGNELGRPVYLVDGERASCIGIDVSENQGTVDWEAVAADGIEFAFVRLGWRGFTEGNLYDDERYADNLAGAKAAGLRVGVYFFSQAIDEEEAVQEAEFVLSRLAGTYLDLPVVFDHETAADQEARANDLTGTQATEIALAFCTAIENAGYQAMVYGNAKDLFRYTKDLLGERPVWLAYYGHDTPASGFTFSFWQYTDSGSVAGVATLVDMNVWFPRVLPLEDYPNYPR